MDFIRWIQACERKNDSKNEWKEQWQNVEPPLEKPTDNNTASNKRYILNKAMEKSAKSYFSLN